MMDTSDLRKGITLELDGLLYQVLEYQHIKVGRGTAQVRLRLKEIRAGHIIERTFQAGATFQRARLEHHSVQYLYREEDLYYFMDQETFEQTALNAAQMGNALSYLKESMTLELLTYNGEPMGVELPNSVELTITETGPAFKGDTAQGSNKPATLESGLVVHVPLFLNTGEVIRVDTRTGQYLERA